MKTRYPISTPRRVVHTRRRARIAMACPLRKYVAVLSVVAALFAAVFAFFARPDTPDVDYVCLLYTSPSPRDLSTSRMPSSA